MAHASRSLVPSEKVYSQVEKEALGIIFAVTKFYRYLDGRQFILQADHKHLITIFGSKKGLPVYTANRLLPWGTIFLNYKIEFLTSKNICYEDSLSRLIPQNTEVFEDFIIATLRTSLRNKNQVWSVFDKLIPRQAKFQKTVSPQKKHFFPDDKAFFKAYKSNMTF